MYNFGLYDKNISGGVIVKKNLLSDKKHGKGSKGFYTALGISAVMIGSACIFAYQQGEKLTDRQLKAQQDLEISEEEAVALYKDYYKDEPFVHVIDTNPDLKMVVNTNKCVLNVRKHGRKLHVISIIDNLVKGASGQAVENMNLIFGLPEGTGLHLKGTRF